MNRKCNEQELPPTLSVSEMAAVLGIGRNSAFKLLKTGAIFYIHVGKSIRIPRKALLEFISSATGQVC